MKAIVVGGGIGGATAVRSLLKYGIEVEAYEKASGFAEIGAGLQLAAPVVHILKELGMGEKLETLGVRAEQLAMYDLRSNRWIYTVPLGSAAASRYGEPYYQVHRPDLLDMLIDGLPGTSLHLGTTATRYEQTRDGVRVYFESGDVAEGDVLIGADGIHSMVRTQMLGEAKPTFSRIVAWRALIPAERLSELNLAPDCHVWLGPNRSAVVYYVHGKELLNFVGMVPSDEITAESWTTTGDVSDLRRSYAGATERLWTIIQSIDSAFITGYFFRYPLPRWSDGRVTILGDAAHPMHPFLAQGACQSIEDAAVLARLLARHGKQDVQTALGEYEHVRYRRASKVQNQARTHEHVWHMSDPREIRERNMMLASTAEIDPDSETVWGWLFRYDPDQEAAKAAQTSKPVMRRAESQRAWDMWAALLKPSDLDRQQHGIREAYDRFQTENFAPADDVSFETVDLGGVPAVRNGAAHDGDGHPVLLHFHGGGYLMGSASATKGLTSRLAVAVGGDVFAVDYRRAPESPFPAAVEDAVAAYRGLLDTGISAERLYITGESSGGGLGVALAMRLRDLSLPQPTGVVAISPMADMAITGRSVDDTAGQDPVGLSLGPSTRILLTQMSAYYMQGHDPRDPLASPIFGKLNGLPPMLIQVARDDALFSDAERLAEAAERDGVDVKLSEYEDSVHVFPMFDFLPEAGDAIREVCEFVAK